MKDDVVAGVSLWAMGMLAMRVLSGGGCARAYGDVIHALAKSVRIICIKAVGNGEVEYGG